MGKKFFTLSYDDGLEQDKQIIELLKKYGIKATFNLNSGLFGREENMEYIGTFGFKNVDKSIVKNGMLIKTVPNRRIPEDEIRQVYDGFEIATHSVHHVRLPKLSESEVETELLTDREKLQQFSSLPVVGHALPYGASGETADRVLKDNGFLYARTVKNKKGNGQEKFLFPDDPLKLDPTCWHINSNIEELLDEFLSLPAGQDDLLFYMWGMGMNLSLNR